MSEAFGVRPSAETVALLDAIRMRREMSGAVDVTLPASRAVPQSPDIAAKTVSRSRRTWMLAAIPVAIVAAMLLFFKTTRTVVAENASAKNLFVLPMENATGDPGLDYVAVGIAEAVARRLDGFGAMKVHSGARAGASDRMRRDASGMAQILGTTALLRTTLRKAHDSLQVSAEILDPLTSATRTIPARSFPIDGIRDVESRIAADIAGAMFRKPLPNNPRESGRPVDAESYKHNLKGWYLLLASPAGLSQSSASSREPARDEFTKAVEIDPLNARAWSGLSSAWASLAVSGNIPFEEGVERTTAAALHALAIDSLEGSAWANIGVTRALKYNNLAMGLELIRKGQKAEPSNPELYLIESTLLRAAKRWDQARDAIRVARSLDPLSLVYLNQEGQLEFCQDRPDQALRIYENERRVNPQNPIAVNGAVRSLALLGRFDEALAIWRLNAESRGDTALARELRTARGANGYWEVRHREGRKRLAKITKGTEPATPFVMIQAQLAAGDPEAAYKSIDDAPASEKPTLYRLSCYAAADEYRRAPRFLARVQRIGALAPQ